MITRRHFTHSTLMVPLAAYIWGATNVAQAQTNGEQTMSVTTEPASPLEAKFLMELVLDVDEQIDAGHTSIAPVRGGTFSGPQLQGKVYDGGADWITKTASGDSSLDVRITLETEDGEVIYMSYTGLVHNGENGLYWRVRPVFQTASTQYDFLNHLVAIGKSKRIPGKVAYDIFEIL